MQHYDALFLNDKSRFTELHHNTNEPYIHGYDEICKKVK